jgi:hypothetical protein
MQMFWSFKFSFDFVIFWLGDCLGYFEKLGDFFESSGHPGRKTEKA